MKRHESIVILSREHHSGLLFCWKIRQGIKKQVPAERMISYVKYFWDNHLQPHFQEEEMLLFPALLDRLTGQALSEHKSIRMLVESSIGTEPASSDKLGVLADALDNHIRFEERTLFPHLEKEVPEQKLAALGTQLQQSHQVDKKDDYPDAFWV